MPKHISQTKSIAASGLVLAAVLGVSQPTLAQAGANDSEVSLPAEKRAAALATQAKAAFATGKTHEALRGFRDAWALAKTPEIAANLATVESSFGLHRDAAEHFQFALSHLSVGATAEQRQAVAAGLDGEKREVATLQIRTVPGTARVSIDGNSIENSLFGDDAYVAPGPHEIRAEGPGYQTAIQQIIGQAGATVAVEFDLKPVEVVRPGPRANTPKTASLSRPSMPSASDRPSVVPLFIGGGLVLASGAVGAIFWLQANSAETDATSQRNALPPGNACGRGTPLRDECAALRNANEAVDRDRNLRTAAFIVGGVAAAGTIAYWAWPRARHPGAPTAGAIVSPGYAFVRANWNW